MGSQNADGVAAGIGDFLPEAELEAGPNDRTEVVSLWHVFPLELHRLETSLSQTSDTGTL